MGQRIMQTCGNCGEHAFFNYGGVMREELFRCDTCGEEKWVERTDSYIPQLSEKEKRCSCGGTFSINAPQRCRKCGSINIIDYQGKISGIMMHCD